MDNDLVSKRRAERCTTHSHACDCREYAHAQEITRKDAEIAELRARIADAPTVCANTDNIVEIAHSLGYYDGKRVALVVVND
jgi:hypothetical protein